MNWSSTEVHYLPLIEQRINALDQATPLQGWDLPEEFATLRCLMEVRMNRQGRREYVQILRLLEAFDLADVRPQHRVRLMDAPSGQNRHRQLVRRSLRAFAESSVEIPTAASDET